MSLFHGKCAIVTGGASGIGRAIGEELARRGANVILADIQEVKVSEIAEMIRHSGGKAIAFHVDVTDSEAVTRLIQATYHQHEKLDFLFNNAGVSIIGGVQDFSQNDWNRIIDVNIHGVINGICAAYPLMIEQGSGYIINTASLAGLIPIAGFAAYAMSKHAIVGLSISLRAEAAEFGVHISVVCPGFVHTPMLFESKAIGLSIDPTLALIRRFGIMPVNQCAQAILRGVEKNHAVITMPTSARTLWFLYRWYPPLIYFVARQFAKQLHRIRLTKTLTSTPYK